MSQLNANHKRCTSNISTALLKQVLKGGNVVRGAQLLNHIKQLQTSVYHPLLLELLNLSSRYRPHILMAISDDPLDNIMCKDKLPSSILAGIPIKEKLSFIASARNFSRDYDLNVTPGFLDDIISTIFPSYVIDGTYQACLEKHSMRDEWAQLVKDGRWDSKQYLHYLVNMYGTGICGVLPGQQLKSARISANLTYEISTFITKVLLLEVVGSSKAHLQEWSATLRDHLEVDDGNIFVQTLYELIGQLHIFKAPDMPAAVNIFIAHLAKDHYVPEKGFDHCTCESISLGPYFNLYGELKRR